MAITARDIEHLLYTETPDPILVMHNDTPRIVAADEVGTLPGACVICSRTELLRRVGEKDLTERDLADIAANLTGPAQNPNA